MALPLPTGAAAGPDAAPALRFAVEGSEAVTHAAAPTLCLRLRIERVGGGPIRSVGLNAQLRIAATRRAYQDGEEERLVEVFGRPDQWSRSLRSLLWTTVGAQVPPFEDSTLFDLHVPCTYDFEVTASKYMHALQGGEVPLELLFGGTIFYPGPGGALRIAPMSWDSEAEHRMPVSVWREALDAHFPGSAWLRLRRDTFDRLNAYKTENSMLLWEDAVEALLDRADADG